MTSSVKITAHCGCNKQVEVTGNGIQPAVLQDSESIEIYVYDDRTVVVQEVHKTASTASVDIGGDGPHK